MGKMAIVMIMGLSFTVGIYTYIITQRSVQASDNYSSYYAFTNARNIAHSSVNIALREIEKHRKSPYEGTFGAGRWRVDTTSVGDTVTMEARSWYMDTSYVMNLILRRYAKPFPEIESAVALNVNDVDWRVSGNKATIDGRDHDMSGALIGPGLPGVTVPSATESTTVISDQPKFFYGTPEVVMSDQTMADPSQFVDEYILNADISYGAGSYGGSKITWGSAADPWIVYCDGRLGSGVKFLGGVDGWGVLVVRGKLWIGGSFMFRGLVIVYEDSEVFRDTVGTSAGTPNIIGALVMAGPDSSRFELKGSPTFAYSSEAVESARLMNKLAAYEIIRWWE